MIAALEAESELKTLGTIFLRIAGGASQPLAKVGTNRVHTVLPYPLNRRRKVIARALRHFVHQALQFGLRSLKVSGRDRKQVQLAQPRENHKLNLMR